MLTLKNKELKEFFAEDITNGGGEEIMLADIRRIGISLGVNGVNGILFMDEKTGKLYKVVKRSSNLLRFLA